MFPSIDEFVADIMSHKLFRKGGLMGDHMKGGAVGSGELPEQAKPCLPGEVILEIGPDDMKSDGEYRKALIDIQSFLRSREKLDEGDRLLLISMINAYLL